MAGWLSACSPDAPAPYPACLLQDCLGADSQGDGQVGDASDVTQTVVKTVAFSLDTAKGEVLKGDVSTAKIDQSYDKDPATVGVQVDVSITTENVPDGAALQLLVDGVQVPTVAQVLNNAGHISGITVPCTSPTAPIAIAVRAIINAAAGDAVVSKDKSLVVSCGTACKATVEALPQGCLTQDQDPTTPGFQQSFVVHSDQSDCTDAYLKVVGPPGTPTETVHVPLNGSTSVPVMATLALDDTGLLGVTVTVLGVVEDTTNPDRGSILSDPVSAVLTTDSPKIVILTPGSGQIKLSDDTSPTTPGVQVTLTGTVSGLTVADKNAVELYIDGTLTSTTTQQPNGKFAIPMSFTTSGTHVLQVKATDSCGLSGQKSKSLAVFVDLATLAIVAPAADAVLRANDDLDKSTPDVLDTVVTVAVTTETPGTDLQVFCKPTLAQAYPDTPTATLKYPDVTLLTVDIPVSLAVAQFGQEIECKVLDNAPNPAGSAPVGFVAALPPPCLKVITPTASVVVTSPSVDFLLETSGLDGQTVQAYLITPGGVPLDAVDLGEPATNHLSGTFAMFDAGAQIPDGTYTLTFQAADKWGNVAGQSLCSDVTRTVTMDTSPPTLVITLPVKATLTTLDDPDSDPVLPGYQIDVEVTITDTHSVCLYLDGVLFACNNNVPDGAGTVLFHDVTLQPGVTALAVTGSDINGNTAAPPATYVTLIYDVPAVKWVSPVGSLKTAQDSLTFTVSVTNPSDGLGVVGASLQVLQNGVDANATVTMIAPGLYTFTLSGLSVGTTTVQVGAFVTAAPDKLGFSGQITVTYKNVKPTATLQTPSDGQVLNAADLTCALGQTDCVLPVTAVFTDLEDGSPVELTVTCGASVTKTPGTANNGTVKLLNIKLLDQNTCDLAIAVTDAAGQTATSPVAHVTVDRVAPKFGLLKAPTPYAGLTLLAINDLDQDPTNGMQVNWVQELAGVPAGATVTCSVSDDLGKSVPGFSAIVPTSASDATFEAVAFGPISLPNGYNIKIVCSVSDAAGNQTQKTLIAQVLADLPLIHLTTPYPNADACATSADCQFGGICYQNVCTVPWNKLSDRKLLAVTSGIPDGAPTRLCSNAPGVTGAPCATAGFVTIAQTTLQKAAATFDLSALPDGSYRVIAESFFAAKGNWVDSLNGGYVQGRERQLMVDTVPPVVSAVTGPSTAGVTPGCLAQVAQTVSDGALPGGKFPFQITTANEDASVSLLVNGVPAGTLTTSGKTGSLIVAIAAEGTATFETVAVDLVGNVSDFQDWPPLFVDTINPVGDFSSPNKTPLIAADNLDVGVVSVANDVEGEPVTLRDLGVIKGVQSILNGVANFAFATFPVLTDGSHTLTADLRDHCGNTATAGTTPVVVVVDTQPPTVAISSPSEGALFTDNDDAAPAQGGYQVALTFATGGASTWSLELGSDCDAGSQNCSAFQAVGTGAIANPGGTEAPVLVTVPFGNTVHYKLRLTVTDASGNSAIATKGFDVLLSGCLVKLNGLPGTGQFNTQNCATPGQNCASVTVPLTASFVGPCGAATAIQLFKGGVAIASAVPVSQAAAFDVTIVDGDSTDLEAVVMQNLNQVGSSGKLGVAADLTKPTIAFAAGTVLGSPTVSGTTALQGKDQDVSATMPDHQIHLQLAMSDTHLVGGKLTALDRTAGGTTAALVNSSTAAPIALTTAPQTVDVQYASLLADQLNTITATVQDSFGNTATATLAVTVDWLAPAAITLNPLAAADVNPRRPSAKLTFEAVGGNGVTGSATSYIVRYAKTAIATQADFDAACDAAKLSGYVPTTPAAAGAAESITVSGPDGRNPTDLCKFKPFTDDPALKSSYYFAVVAVDAAGNKGPISNYAVTDKLRLNYMRITNSGGAGSTYDVQAYRARVFGLGDLNGDGFADVGFGGGATAPFCILYGRAGTADIDLATEPASGIQCLANSGGLAGVVGGPADVNGDGVSDLIVGNKTGSGIPREVRVYLGNAGAQLSATPAVIITGIVNNSAAAAGPARLQTVGNFNGDVSASNKPIMDIAVRSAKDLNYAQSETVYVIPGNAGWSNAAPLTIDVTNSLDRSNNNVVRVRLSDGTQVSALFGQNFHGGNVLLENGGVGQQFDELVVSQQAANQQMYVIRGRELSGALDMTMTVASTGLQPNDKDAVRIYAAGTGAQSFAAYFDLVEFDGQPGLDVVMQHQTGSIADHPGFYWARGSTIQSKFVAPPQNTLSLAVTGAVAGFTDLFTTAAGYLNWTYVWAPQNIGNFFDDPSTGLHTDVMYARPPFTGATGGGQQVILRMAVPRAESQNEIGFVYEDIVITDPFVKNNSNFGYNTVAATGIGFAPAGDFNQDGFVDLVIGSADGAGGVQGSTLIVY
jgi:hypothetical protein